MILWDVGAAIGLGLIGSLHCVPMCGPIVLASSVPIAYAPFPRQLVAHLSYNAGRIATYGALGAVAGVAGGALGGVGRLAGIADSGSIVAGALLIVAGLALAGLASKRRWVRFGPPRFGAALPRLAARWLQAPSAPARFILGLILGLLPCGLVYAALLNALATGSAWSGAVMMLAFGAGTAPALVGVGLASGPASRLVDAHGPRVVAGTVVAMGVLLVARGLMAEPVVAAACHL